MSPHEPAASAAADAAAELERLRYDAGIAPPGHFYSPLIDRRHWAEDAERIYAPPPRTLPGIDMREVQQLALLERLAAYYPELPFTDQRQGRARYQFLNEAYSYSDAICLYGLLRHSRPRRVVEVGSGWSSCAMLDTDERFLGGATEFHFIDPHTELLRSLLHGDDLAQSGGEHARLRISSLRLQDVPLAEFQRLQAGDILFIDSTHVSKLFSDVNHLLFEVLPALAEGVLVHIHDIFWPFEYPRVWIEQGRSWNEAYALRAFLMWNPRFEVVLMNTFMEHFHAGWFEAHMPLALKNPGGSLWLRALGGR